MFQLLPPGVPHVWNDVSEPQQRKVELWARNCREFCRNWRLPRHFLGSFTCRKFISPPKEGALRIFSTEKSDGYGRVWTRELGVPETTEAAIRANFGFKFEFWGAFAKLRKATFSFVMSVRPSARNSSAPTGRIFMKFDIWRFFENLPWKLKFHSNSTRITHNLYVNFWSLVTEFFLEREMFRTNLYRKSKHTLCSISFLCFRKSRRSWDNAAIYCTGRQATDENIIRHYRTACWISKATGTHSEYSITMATRTRLTLRFLRTVLYKFKHTLFSY